LSTPLKVHAGLVHTSGAVVFRRTERGVRLLVLRAQSAWDFPKGEVVPGESEFATAQREVADDTGLSDIDFPFDDAYVDTLPDAGGKVARYYLAETDEADVELGDSPGLRRAPRDERRWVSFDEAEDLLPPRLALVLDWVRANLGAGLA